MAKAEMLTDAMRGYARALLTQMNDGSVSHVSLYVIKHEDDELDFVDIKLWDADGESAGGCTEFIGGDEE